MQSCHLLQFKFETYLHNPTLIAGAIPGTGIYL